MTDPTDRRTSFGLYPENFQLHSTDVGHTSPFNQDGTPMPRENDRPVITEENLTKAVMLVQDAIHGRKYYSKPDLQSMQRHIFYHHWICQLVIHSICLFHLAIAFFEYPASINIFPTVNATIYVTNLIELCILGFYSFEMVYKRSFIQVKDQSWKKNRVYWINWVCIGLTAIDIIIYLIFKTRYYRVTRFLRPAFVIYNFPSVRHYFKNLRSTIPEIAHVFAVLFGLIIFYVLFMDVLLGDDHDPGFVNTVRGFLSLFILSTTANYPDVSVYSVTYINPMYAVFFVSYCIIVTKIMLSLVTAVVYNRCQFYISRDAEKWRPIRREKLRHAFDALDVDKDRVLHFYEWSMLFSRLCPHYTHEKVSLLYRILDENGSNDLKLREFRRIVTLLRLTITATAAESQENHLAKYVPWFYRTRIFFFLKKVVLSKGFGWAMDLVVLASGIRIILVREIAFSLTTKTILESVILGFFIGEAIVKLLVLGTGGYWASHWNKFDALLIIVSIISTIISLFPGLNSQMIVRIILLFRIIRLFRLGRTSANIRSLYMTLWRLLPAFVVHALVLVVVYYIFAQFGMLFWAGAIYRGNPKLVGSSYEAANFYATSHFNTFAGSMLTLFELMIQNNWFVIAGAFELVSGTVWTWAFFIVFNISTAVVVVNILVAFILDGFITQWKISQLQIKSIIQIRIEELAAESEARQNVEISRESIDSRPGDKNVTLAALEQVEQFLGAEDKGDENIIWTATDSSFKIDPLEFVDESDDDTEDDPPPVQEN